MTMMMEHESKMMMLLLLRCFSSLAVLPCVTTIYIFCTHTSISERTTMYILKEIDLLYRAWLGASQQSALKSVRSPAKPVR